MEHTPRLAVASICWRGFSGYAVVSEQHSATGRAHRPRVQLSSPACHCRGKQGGRLSEYVSEFVAKHSAGGCREAARPADRLDGT